MAENYTSPTYTIAQHLQEKEKIIWTGSPRQGIILQPSDLFLIPFSICWVVFAIIWEYEVISFGAPYFFAFWGIPFVLVGLYLIFGRFYLDAHRRRRTYYILTDLRIIIVSGLLHSQMEDLDLTSLSGVNLLEKIDGSGSIFFQIHEQNKNQKPWAEPKTVQKAVIELIPEVRQVYQAILNRQHKIRRGWA